MLLCCVSWWRELSFFNLSCSYSFIYNLESHREKKAIAAGWLSRAVTVIPWAVISSSWPNTAVFEWTPLFGRWKGRGIGCCRGKWFLRHIWFHIFWLTSMSTHHIMISGPDSWAKRDLRVSYSLHVDCAQMRPSFGWLFFLSTASRTHRCAFPFTP